MIKLNKASAARLAPMVQKTSIIAAVYLLLLVLLVLGITPEQHDIQIGAPAPLDILASKDVNDTVTTDERRAAAAAAVEPSYKSIDFSVVGSVSSDMEALFEQLFALREGDWPDASAITGEELAALNQTLAIDLSMEEYAAIRESDEDNLRVYEAFQRVAAKKQFVGTKELDAIIATAAMQVPSTYKLVNYVTNSGSIITATANILIEKDGQQIRGVGIGDGPIDAAFQAIEQIIGHHYELDDFQIQTVTEGRDAMGSALVKLRSGGRVYSGNGISTDIIGASIRAYVSALNKIVYEEN